MGKKLYHGAAWYPELWEEDVLRQDIALMQQTGINVVRIGEFAWSNMEPQEGHIDLSFFVKVIGWLSEAGIDTVMCTPTPTPPIWFTHGHPERMYVNEQLQVMGHGSRQHACTNHPYFREKAAIITEHIAQAIGPLPGVIGWQLDNEFKAHVAECLCETCRSQWQQWLEERYGTIEQLNDAWGTQIWSEYYHSFDQVPQPGPAPFLHNSSLKTNYQLFSMEKIAQFADEQAAIIRNYSEAPITHNSSVAFHVDNERLFRNLDFASFDTYATFDNIPGYLINNDLWRNFKRGRDYWIMETSPSFAASLESYAKPHPNGYLKAEAVAAYALGAEGFCYWLWRQQRAGCEQPHGSVISAWGKPTVGYPNVLEVEQARQEIEATILSTRPVQAEVALTYSDRAKAFLKTEPHRKLSHRGLMTDFYGHLLNTGLHRDVVPEGAPLDGYKLLFTPFLPYVSSDYTERALQLVEAGGVWVIGPFTGGRTAEHTVHTDAALGVLERLAGVETVYTFPMEGSGSAGSAFGVNAPLSLWSSVFEPKEAAAVGVLAEGGLAPGLAFITEKQHGKGKIVMLGSLPAGEDGERLLNRLILRYADEAGVNVRSDVTKGTLVAPRRGVDHDVWVVVNMDGAGGSVTLPRGGFDPVTQEHVAPGKLELGRYAHKVIRFNH
ncbi:beta-galactosidase [Paenibacillus aceris]|uniref:Beta-galactosidase n=1 Tax=Paenibacillus aceris TaxID=869555 RepID=A0ABS4I6W6_9BACL|nr:beta-galactosidase [Paenibacillus aceris]MBP1966640.1 beta-galactosidase [Paenibacillus aceris]NHW38876.1 beta-galactosidase [Paenibacillus aceris]